MNARQDPVQQVLRKLYGKPCWNVRQGYGSFLTFEFGTPHLRVQEPRRIRRSVTPRVRKLLSRRHVFVHGEWHLWIYCCRWTILQDGKLLARSSSRPSTIDAATRQLQGQALTQVSIDGEKGRSRFEFDFGGALETRRYDQTSEQWLLYDPTRHVLQLRADGQYSYDPETIPCTDTRWKLRPVEWNLL